MNCNFKYALISLDNPKEILQKFNSLEEISRYYTSLSDDGFQNDLVKLVDNTKELNFGNFILYTHIFLKWHFFNEKFAKGEIDQYEFKEIKNQILYEEKSAIKDLKAIL